MVLKIILGRLMRTEKFETRLLLNLNFENYDIDLKKYFKTIQYKYFEKVNFFSLKSLIKDITINKEVNDNKGVTGCCVFCFSIQIVQ